MPRLVTLIQASSRPDAGPFLHFHGFPFRAGEVTLLAAAPGAGKTSWALALASTATAQKIPTGFFCYEMTPYEILERLGRQATGKTLADPHDEPDGEEGQRLLAQAGMMLVETPTEKDTPDRLVQIMEEAFPHASPALLVVDYLQRVPYVDHEGRRLGAHQGRDGTVVGKFKRIAQEKGWHVLLIAALEKTFFVPDMKLLQNPARILATLLGDERVVYDPDRVLALFRGKTHSCGCCYDLNLVVAKDRRGPVQVQAWVFRGRWFLPEPKSISSKAEGVA